MTINIGNIKVNYIQYGKGKDIVLLHGWGQNIEMMMPLGNELQDKYRITILDLPGFGQSDVLNQSWTMDDYVNLFGEFLKELKIKHPILMAHSFGGRLSIRYASRNKVDKLVLFGSPCIREERKSKKEKMLKSMKKLPGMNKIGEFAKNFIGSTDYKNATPVMRETLVNVVNEDLSEDAKKIEASTLLIWGSLDEQAPLEDAKKLEIILKDGGLVVLDGYTHYAYLEALPSVINILNNFL